MQLQTTQEVISRLNALPMQPLPAPPFEPRMSRTARLVLGVSSMRDHMTDEGFQITEGLSQNGYLHCGYGLTDPRTNVEALVESHAPGTVVVQDKREWSFNRGNFRDPHAEFRGIEALKRDSIFKLTILKDSHQNPVWHAEAAKEMDCHAWIVYYHPDIVHRLAPYTRRQHLIRTYHTVNPAHVPQFSPENREGTLFSGAVSGAYPERQHILSMRGLPVTLLQHPGYHRSGCATPGFLQYLTQFKVSICTSSMYGYALRKIIESTAAGCRVITDLPVDDKLPLIDDNLIRVNFAEMTRESLTDLIRQTEAEYSPERQQGFAEDAVWFYDYKRMTRILACDIAILRDSYGSTL
jgi:hypothetical protein